MDCRDPKSTTTCRNLPILISFGIGLPQGNIFLPHKKKNNCKQLQILFASLNAITFPMQFQFIMTIHTEPFCIKVTFMFCQVEY